MIFFCCVLPLSSAWTLSGAALAPAVHGVGWLDRAVHFYKHNFVEDVRKVAPIQIQASLERAPAGYVDSGAWDYAAVRRLLALLAASEAAAPVRRALRRALQPARRYISRNDTYQLFPSRGKDRVNEIYYDFTYDEGRFYSQLGPDDLDAGDSSVVVLRNPVEARLPSARISVKLLRVASAVQRRTRFWVALLLLWAGVALTIRDILEARAAAARQMPSTTASSIPWITMNKTQASTKTPAGKAATDEGADDTTANEGTSDGGAEADKDADEGNAEAGTEAGEEGTEAPEKGEPSLDVPEDNAPGLRTGASHVFRLSSVPWWHQ